MTNEGTPGAASFKFTIPRGAPWDQWQQAYNPSTSYDKLDAVQYNGSSFISLQDSNQGHTPDPSGPTAWWDIIALKGVDGTGSVVSINSIGPDGSGNVLLTAADVGARASSWVPSWSDITSKPAYIGAGADAAAARAAIGAGTSDLALGSTSSTAMAGNKTVTDLGGVAKASAMVVVNHGSNASTARPSGVGCVRWLGTVEPLNAAAGDTGYGW